MSEKTNIITAEELKQKVTNIVNRLTLNHAYSSDEAIDDILELVKEYVKKK